MSPPIEEPLPTVTDAERQRVMVETLLSLFASDKRLRRWARGTLDDAVYSEIPGDGASRAELAHAITDLCREHRLEREIVDGLAQARPWRATTIRELARTLGISPPKVRWPFGPPRPRPTNPHRVMVVAAMSIAMIVAIAGVLCGVLCNQASQAPTKDGTKPTGQSTTETVIARGSQAFEVEARIERPTWQPEEPIRIEVRSNRSGYLWIFSPEGDNANPVFPCSDDELMRCADTIPRELRRIVADRWRVVPDADDRYRPCVGSHPGPEVMVVIVTDMDDPAVALTLLQELYPDVSIKAAKAVKNGAWSHAIVHYRVVQP